MSKNTQEPALAQDSAAKLKAHGEQMRRDFPPQPCAQCAALRAALERARDSPELAKDRGWVIYLLSLLEGQAKP